MTNHARRWTMLNDEVLSQRIDPILSQEIFQTPVSNNNNKKKRKTYRPLTRQTHTRYADSNRIFKRMVPIDYCYQSKKELSVTFPFTCPVTARRLTLCTALSTWSPSFTSRDLYLCCRSPASRAKHSYFDSSKLNGSNSKSMSGLIA